jgi:hypothetical protein
MSDTEERAGFVRPLALREGVHPETARRLLFILTRFQAGGLPFALELDDHPVETECE